MLPSPQSPSRRPLHGFTLPRLWGGQRLLRCSNIPPPIPDHSDPSPRPDDDDDDDDDEAFQEFRLRLLSHYDIASDVPSSPPPPPAAAGDKPRPWNLRKRGAACSARQSDKCSSSTSPSKRQKTVGTERRAVTLQLTAEEIEEDLKKMCPERCTRRKPKRRGQKAQRIMESLNPGECLCRMMEEWYRIPEGRKRR